MRTLLRWVMVPVGALAAWYVVLVVGIAATVLLDALCPAELMVSGLCTAWWHAPAVEGLILACTAIVSASVVVLPALIAPSGKLRVAVVAFACGAAFALSIAVPASLWMPLVVAALSGSAALWFAATRWRSRAA